MHDLTANELRRGFLDFFAVRGHTVVPSASLIPHDPDLLFTVAGMVPFKPYFLGEERAPYARAVTVQKCVRAGGKDSDLEEVGKDGSHLSFFEMLGNFSFGDYFKAEAIPMAWEMVTELLGIDPEQLWVTVHVTDDEAEALWIDEVGVDPSRVQRLEADNWWGPPGGPPGPCGPCSEIFVDKGPTYGGGGGPARGADERFLEIWNLVFMQYERDVDGVDTDLPARSIDTGAGLERILGLLQGVDSVYETDVLAPLVEVAQSVSGVRLGSDPTSDVSLRILAEHARTMTMLIGDGVIPSNEKRGYVLRRIMRRAVRHAFLLGIDDLVAPRLVGATVEVMGEAYPEIVANQGLIEGVAAREEEGFRRTLATGLVILDDEIATLAADAPLPGSVAFTLHDTHGFPLELTQEIAGERGVTVDQDGFDADMAIQKSQSRPESGEADQHFGDYQEVRDAHGSSEFVGRAELESKARILAVIDDGVVLDRTPFYAESGGQVGDTGTITTDTGQARIIDTVYALPGLHRHVINEVDGVIEPGQLAVATVDADRRAAIRRNHTGTHILHWALREVLGDHVKQQGSMVGPDHLRFDFSHYNAVTDDELAAIEELANREVLTNAPVRHFETSKDHAGELGAVAFFGDKYGDVVRVLEAGGHSLELCGGTHVGALGDIGPIKIVSEGSIGSNIRRVEALTGMEPLRRMRIEEQRLADASSALGVSVDEIVDGAQRRSAELKELRRELEAMRASAAAGRAGDLVAQAVDGVVVARVDGLTRGDLRTLAVSLRDRPEIRAAVLGGEAEGGGAALVGATPGDSELDAGTLLEGAGALIGGGGRPGADLTVLGGKNPAGVDEALDLVRARLRDRPGG